MANFEPPSFALELDFEAPSFSLGLDFDFDWELQRTVKEDLASESRRRCSTKAILRKILEDDDDFESPKMGRNPQVLDQNRPLKRLCPPTITRQPPAAKQKMHLEMHNFDEKIEEFSSQEQQRRANKRPSAQHHSVYNSSKLPLHGRHRVLSTQSTGCLRARERKWVMNSQASTDVGTSSNKLVFSKSTVSPLRRFPLIDSDTDSDDLPVCVDKNTEANILNSLIKRRHSNTEDLWKDFSAEKGFQIKTPALDEVCEECFRSMKKKRTIPNDNKGCHRSSNVDQSRGQICDLSDCRLPAHRYFFHEDPRIRNLVRTRLPNFFPLGVQDDRGNKHSRAPAIDYMSQFNHGEGSKKVAGKNNAQMGSTKSRKGSKKVACKNDAQMGSTKSGKGSKKVASKNNAQKGSTKSRKNSKKKNSEEVLPGSGSWVNPNSRPEIPKDAGKGRVPAVGRSSQSTGHWYTIPGGKKAYVSKNGQELIGRTAYGQYKKMENSGAGSFLHNRSFGTHFNATSDFTSSAKQNIPAKEEVEPETKQKQRPTDDGDSWWADLISWVRIVLCFVSMMLTTFIWALIMLLLLPWPYQRIRQGNIYGHITGRLLMWILGNPIKIEGDEHSKERAIYISNHASPIDIFLIMWLTPTGTVGIAKKEIIWYPLFGQLYVLANHVRIDRSNPTTAIESMKKAVHVVVKNNLSLIIFPEGTRSKNGRLLPFKKGFIHLAIQSGLPIVPIVLTGTHLAWRKGSLHVRSTPLTVKFLPPIRTVDWTADKIDDYVDTVHQVYVRNLPELQRPLQAS